MRILSPVSSGNGACIVHKMLEKHISDYSVVQYNPYTTLFPPALYFSGRSATADIIHSSPDYAIYHTRKRIPLVLTIHGFVLDAYIRKYSTFLQSLHYQTDLLFNTKRALRKARIITAVSNFAADIVKNELNSELDIRTIYNGIDESIFLPSGNTNKNKKIKVLISGHLSEKKGSHWIKAILDRLDPDISLHYTSGFRSTRRHLDHPGLSCLGNVPHNEMPSVYREHDLLLFPTVREGFGLAAAEGMSCGLPIVATNCSALPELVIHGKGGYLCALGDVEDFAEKINLLAENSGLRKEMGEFNRARVENKFSAVKMVKSYKEIFEEALS